MTKSAPQPLATVSDSLRGTWRVVPSRGVPGSDTIKYRYGFAPVGYLVYDATGHVFWQILRKSAMDSLRIGRERHVPDSILMRLSEGFLAQFGTYEVDANLRTVTHHYEGEIPPWRRGYEVATPFLLKADSLFIGPDSLTSLRFVRVR
ncbi:MAG: lipocalin-like domain-containing protein [Gemmatimonas sp.]